MNENLLTPEEVADFLKVSKRTVTNFCKEGKLNHVRVGVQIRIPQSALENFLSDEKENENE